MHQLLIRPATPHDVDLLLRFIHELADFERLGHQVQATTEQLKESLFGNPQAPECEAIIAFKGDEALGFALFFHNYSTFLTRKGLYLEDLYVTPNARGQGVGLALLRFLAQIALKRNCGRLEWSVLDWNEQAIKFYQGLGAKGMTDWNVFRLDGNALVQLAGQQ